MARKKNKAITINRNRYNDIKRMDHSSMEEYVNEVYEKGVEAGQKAAAGSFDTALAMETISQIKGIGPVKVQQIKLALIAAGAKDAERAAGGQNA